MGVGEVGQPDIDEGRYRVVRLGVKYSDRRSHVYGVEAGGFAGCSSI